MKKIALGLLAATPVAAFAAVDAAVQTAITAGQTTGTELVTAFAVAGAAVWIVRRVMKRFGLSL
jgi:hypothetical protein